MFQNHLQFVQLCGIIASGVSFFFVNVLRFVKIHKFVTFRPHSHFIMLTVRKRYFLQVTGG